MGFLDLFSNSGNKFAKANAVSADKQLLLQTGGIMVYTNQWTPETLKMDQSKRTADQILDLFWNIEDREDSLNIIENLISTGGSGLMGGEYAESREQIDERLKKYTNGDKSSLSGPESTMLDKIVNLLTGYKFEKVKLTRPDLDSITTTLAWDIERAAFIARLAYNNEYLTENETWEILRRTREIAASEFNNWRDYGISFIKGRSIVMCDSSYSDMTDIWANVCLMADPKWGIVWTWGPLR